MGSMVRMLNSGPEYIRKKAQYDQAVALRDANNAAKTRISAAQTTLRDANNAAAASLADARRKIQTASNTASAEAVTAQRMLQAGGNAANRRIVEGYRAVQEVYNSKALEVAEAKREVIKARNEAAASGNDVVLAMKSLTNMQRGRMADKRFAAAEEDIGLAQQAATRGGVWGRIAASEAVGAAYAAAAAVGVGSSGVQAYADSLNLKAALEQEQADRELSIRSRQQRRVQAAGLLESYGGMQTLEDRASLDREIVVADRDNTAITDDQDFSAILDQQDFSPVLTEKDFTVFTPDIDYTVYEKPKKLSFLQKGLTFLGAGAATYFGGPQAGMAVFDASMAMHDYASGNFAAGASGMDRALDNASAGFKVYRAGDTSGNKNPFAGKPWGADLKL
jgi:hypothetical protein